MEAIVLKITGNKIRWPENLFFNKTIFADKIIEPLVNHKTFFGRSKLQRFSSEAGSEEIRIKIYIRGMI